MTHDNSNERKDQVSEVVAERFVSFVNDLERWLNEVMKMHDGDSEAVLKHVSENYRRNLLGNIEYHQEMQKAELTADNPAKAAYHELMVMLYDSLLTQQTDTHNIVRENNALLKGNRLLMVQINEKLKQIAAS